MANTYTFQVGFTWDQSKTADKTTWPLSFVFVQSNGNLYTPKSGSSSYNGRQSTAGNPDDIHYEFVEGDSIRWEIYALSSPTSGTLKLSNLRVPFELMKDKSTQTPFKANNYSSPIWVAATGSKTCDHLPGATSGTAYPYWTPPTGGTFVIDKTGTYRFWVDFDVAVDGRKFAVDPEMITGPANSGGGGYSPYSPMFPFGAP